MKRIVLYFIFLNMLVLASCSHKYTEKEIVNSVFIFSGIKQVENTEAIIDGQPTDSQPYYTVVVGNKRDDHFEAMHRFHVYTEPELNVKYYDAVNNKELTPDEWTEKLLGDAMVKVNELTNKEKKTWDSDSLIVKLSSKPTAETPYYVLNVDKYRGEAPDERIDVFHVYMLPEFLIYEFDTLANKELTVDEWKKEIQTEKEVLESLDDNYKVLDYATIDYDHNSDSYAVKITGKPDGNKSYYSVKYPFRSYSECYNFVVNCCFHVYPDSDMLIKYFDPIENEDISLEEWQKKAKKIRKAVVALPKVYKGELDGGAIVTGYPTKENPFYSVKTTGEYGISDKSNCFRVYPKPKLEIKYYNPFQDRELALEDYRKEMEATEMVTKAVLALPEFQKRDLSEYDVHIMNSPTQKEPYYTINIKVTDEQKSLNQYHFHVYTQPELKIKYYDTLDKKEHTYEEWQQVLEADTCIANVVFALPEINKNELYVVTENRPTDSNPFYTVKVSSIYSKPFDPLFFHVYTQPEPNVKYYDPLFNKELSLEEWRKVLEKEKTEKERIEAAVRSLPEVQELKGSSYENVYATTVPNSNDPFYTVVAAYQPSSPIVVAYKFHVYVKPELDIKFYNFLEDKEYTLDEWRKQADYKYNTNADFSDYMDAYIVIADTSSSDYEFLNAEMIQLSKDLYLPIERHNIYDKERKKLCLPIDSYDMLYAGSYMDDRRFLSDYLSLGYCWFGTEASSDSESKKQSKLAIIVLVTENKKEAELKLRQVRNYSKNAFVYRSCEYFGCIH